jgi:putative Mn2+ efflux pump MntP
MLSIILIGLSLSMDAFAVSVCSGISIPGLKVSHAVQASLFFGVFQFIMPVAGWFAGRTFISYIQTFDHWIAFGLLAFIGGKMILEALREGLHAKGDKTHTGGCTDGGEKVNAGNYADIRNLKTLLSLALATSIDALAVGLSFSILNSGIWGPAALIGGITFVVCLAGFEFGRRIGFVFGRGAQILGGIILIGIGIKILIEHFIGG